MWYRIWLRKIQSDPFTSLPVRDTFSGSNGVVPSRGRASPYSTHEPIGQPNECESKHKHLKTRAPPRRHRHHHQPKHQPPGKTLIEWRDCQLKTRQEDDIENGNPFTSHKWPRAPTRWKARTTSRGGTSATTPPEARRQKHTMNHTQSTIFPQSQGDASKKDTTQELSSATQSEGYWIFTEEEEKGDLPRCRLQGGIQTSSAGSADQKIRFFVVLRTSTKSKNKILSLHRSRASDERKCQGREKN